MRTKNVEICIRVNEKEKKDLERKARKSGLSLASYLRKVGLEKEIYAIPDKDFYIIYLQISNLKNKIHGLSNETIIACLEKIKSNFLEIYNSDKEEMEDGNN